MSALQVQLAALAATLAIELPIAAALAPARARAATVLAALFANLVSHALATAAIWTVAPPWIALELAVTAFEAVVLRSTADLTWRRAVALALVANAASAALSLAVH